MPSEWKRGWKWWMWNLSERYVFFSVWHSARETDRCKIEGLKKQFQIIWNGFFLRSSFFTFLSQVKYKQIDEWINAKRCKKFWKRTFVIPTFLYFFTKSPELTRNIFIKKENRIWDIDVMRLSIPRSNCSQFKMMWYLLLSAKRSKCWKRHEFSIKTIISCDALRHVKGETDWKIISGQNASPALICQAFATLSQSQRDFFFSISQQMKENRTKSNVIWLVFWDPC